MELSLATHRDSDTATVVVGGDVDLATVAGLDRQIASALDTPGIAAVTVDLSDVTFLDSSGISALIKARKLADERKIRLRVNGASGFIRQVLELSGVWQYLSGSVE